MATTLDKLYALKIPEIRAMFIIAMEKAVSRAVIDEMIKAIENNDAEALYQASGFSPAVLDSVIEEVEKVYKETAEITIDGWPTRIKTPYGLRVPIFTMRNPKVEKELQEYSSNFITLITDEARENIRTILAEGVARGANPRNTALDIVGRINPLTRKREGGIIGLSRNQVHWVSNARKYLENLDRKYLTLDLRDKRFDSLVENAIKEGRKLTTDEVTKLIGAYNNKALKWRADAISRTETIQAINRGEYAAIQQNIDEGLITEDMVSKWWDDTGDSRTRYTHLQLGKKYNRDNKIPLNEPFVSASGSKLLYPGDRSLGADASEVIHCRCKAQYFIDFVKGTL